MIDKAELTKLQDRVANLERLSVTHGAHLSLHDTSIATVTVAVRDLKNLVEAAEVRREVRDTHMTMLLEKILGIVTPSAK